VEISQRGKRKKKNAYKVQLLEKTWVPAVLNRETKKDFSVKGSNVGRRGGTRRQWGGRSKLGEAKV